MITKRQIVRLIGLAVVAIATIALASWAWIAAMDAIRQLRTPFPRELKLAQELYLEQATRTTDASINYMALLLRIAATNTVDDLNHLQQAHTDFKIWISNQKTNQFGAKVIITYPTPLTIDLGPSLDKIDEINNRIAASKADPNAGLAACRELLAMAGKASARAEGIEQFRSLTTDWRKSYIRLLLIPLIVLIGLLAWLAGPLLFRIAFVRKKLVESTAIIERQQKLAHFGELAAGLAHEIRNPLCAINARLFTLQKALQQSPSAKEDAGVIHNEIIRLDRIVNEFLELARPGEPKLATVHARPLMEEVSQLLSPALREQQIELQITKTVETAFRADPQQLEQALINLVQNAADAIDKKGVVTLSARFALQTLRGKSQEVVILEITDDGPGIAPEVRERLFDPFFSTKEKGTGLGLSISARIIDQHGGEITCETELGRGTTFGIVLPVKGAGDEA